MVVTFQPSFFLVPVARSVAVRSHQSIDHVHTFTGALSESKLVGK